MTDLYWVTGINPEPWTTGTAYRRGHGMGIAKDGKLKAYQEGVREEFEYQNGHAMMHEGLLAVKFYFWRSTGYGNRADATNLLKATEDALQDILYKNDRDNHEVRSVIMEQEPDTLPCILIEVSPFERPVIEAPKHQSAPKWADSEWTEPTEELF